MDHAFLTDLITTPSPSGYEEPLMRQLDRRYRDVFDWLTVDPSGTLTAIANESANFHVLLAAHADEISLVVTGYNGDGTLKVGRNGGVRAALYLGSPVRVLTPSGEVPGVVGTNDDLVEKAKLEASDLFVDIGAESRKEAEAMVPKGSFVIHDAGLRQLAGGKLSGRAMDDRACVAIIFEATRRAVERGVKCGVYCCATTGEETTGRGAYFAAARLKPDICVAVDVTYADDYPGADAQGDQDVKLGGGGVICRGSIPHPALNRLLEDCAKELGLPVQYEVFPGRTATDADTMLRTCQGLPQALFSLPLRYMHSPVEVASERDMDAMVEVLALFLQKVDEDLELRPYTLD